MPSRHCPLALLLVCTLALVGCETPPGTKAGAALFTDEIEGVLRVEETERKGLVSIVRIEVLSPQDPEQGAAFIADCFARIATRRLFSYYVVLQRDRIVRQDLGAEPEAQQEYVVGFTRSRLADLMIEFPSYYDPSRHYAIEPAAGDG